MGMNKYRLQYLKLFYCKTIFLLHKIIQKEKNQSNYKEYGFQIITGQDVIYLAGFNKQDAYSWVEALKSLKVYYLLLFMNLFFF